MSTDLASVNVPRGLDRRVWPGMSKGLSVPKPDGPELSKPSVKQHLAALRMLFD
jgi:hypothetical protein